MKSLARYLGLTVPIVPEKMPDADFGKITGRDMRADMAAYIVAASSPAEKALQSARDNLSVNNNSANRYMRDIAQQDFDRAKKEAEADFPKVFSSLRDAYDDFMDSWLVADAQSDYDAAVAQYERGMISRNMLQSTEQMLEIIKARYEQQRIQLWLLFMEYEYNLVKF